MRAALADRSDATVDPDGLVQGVLAYKLAAPSAAPPSQSAADVDSARAETLLVQVLFAYAYEMRASYGDATPESAWTICKLCRSLVCFTEPDSDVYQTLRALYRRALTQPLYRSWAVCERVRGDVADLLGGPDAVSHALGAISQIDAIFSLATTGSGNPDAIECVLRILWDLWLAPLRAWLGVPGRDLQPLSARVRHVCAPPRDEYAFMQDVGEPGSWDLPALEVAAKEAVAEGGGGFT